MCDSACLRRTPGRGRARSEPCSAIDTTSASTRAARSPRCCKMRSAPSARLRVRADRKGPTSRRAARASGQRLQLHRRGRVRSSGTRDGAAKSSKEPFSVERKQGFHAKGDAAYQLHPIPPLHRSCNTLGCMSSPEGPGMRSMPPTAVARAREFPGERRATSQRAACAAVYNTGPAQQERSKHASVCSFRLLSAACWACSR